MKTAEKTATLPVQLAELINRLPPEKGFATWFNIPEIREAYALLSQQHIDGLGDTSKPKGKGRGIVMPGGGTKYFPSMWVGINRIRAVGCKLPIEVWYLGEAEMDPTMMRLLEPFNVTFRDAMELRKKHPMRILNGWELKPYAIAHSAFNDVLFIDADCAPAKDPTFLFDSPQYLKTGAIFWPDYPHWILQTDSYSAFGAPSPKNTKIPGDDYQFFGNPIDPRQEWDLPVESGQMVINKSKCWEPLSLALFYCANSDYYFRFVHGDKETFHLGWRRLKCDYAMPQRWPHWDLHTALQYDFKGEIIFVHRNNDKWRLKGNIMGSGRIPFERECFDLAAELGKRWSGRIWDNSNPTAAEQKDIAALVGKTFFYHRVGFDARLLEFGKDGQISKGMAEHELSWAIFHVDGQPRLSISGKDAPTCFMQPARKGQWKGNWLVGERMPVSLIPIDFAE
jgi:hypothetical protein